jgi:hypothetical protein
VGLIEITPSYDLAAVSNVGNATSNTIQFTNSDTGFVTTANATIGKTLTVEGFRITAQAEANDDLQAITLAGADTNQAIHITNANDSTGPYSGALQIGTNLGQFGGLGVAGNVHVGRGVYTQDLDVAGNAIIRGDLSVLGTTTTIDTDNLRVQDPIIELGKDNTASPVVDLGLIMTRPSDSSNVAVIFDESTDTLELGYTDGGASDTTITMDDSAPLSVNVNGNLSVSSNVEVGTANLFVDTVNSRVGIGTTEPGATLEVTGNAFVSGDLEIAGNLGSSLVNLIYPIGAIYISVNSTDPGTIWSGTTWAAFGAGKTLVGLDSGDADFNQVEETGGAKTHTLTINQMPAHNHSYQDRVRNIAPAAQSGTNRYEPSGVSNIEYNRTTGSKGGTQAHNNLQPYIVTYMWKRTA